MTILQVYRLQPRGAFHFGEQGIGFEASMERCPSDTLYSALLIEAARAGKSFFAPSDGYDEQTPLDPPLLVSSCFPYAGRTPLLPRPQLRLPISSAALEQHPKLGKRLKYVSPAIFRLILAGGDHTLDPFVEQKGRLLMNQSVWIAHEDAAQPLTGRFWTVERRPHVTVDRVRNASNYFETGEVHFAEGCGLYVMVLERTSGAAALIGDLLMRLGDSGLGGRRSAGKGQFTVEGPVPFELPDAPAANRYVLLSRYRPAEHELAAGVLGAGAAYGLTEVSGWLQTPATVPVQRRRSVRLLTEGSVVRALPGATAPLGSICDVRPDYGADGFPHPVWRYGLALGVGIGAEVNV